MTGYANHARTTSVIGGPSACIGAFPAPWVREGKLLQYTDRLRVPCERLATSEEAVVVFAECFPRSSAAGPDRNCFEHEELWLCLMDDECRARGVVQLAEGTEDGVRVDPAQILSVAFSSACRAFLLAHNHPSGDPKPSPDDWMRTVEVLRAAARVGLELVDHLIVGDGTYVSLRSMNEPMFEKWCPP